MFRLLCNMNPKNLLILILSLISAFSCKENYDKNISSSFDSLARKIDSLKVVDSSSVQSEEIQLTDLINEFSTTSNYSLKWTDLNKNNKILLSNDLKNKYIITPLFTNQILNIKNIGITDTSVIFLGNNNSAFVFDIQNGENEIKKLPENKNALMLLKIREIKNSNKIYLVKKSTEYLHKEIKLIEFKITCDLIEIHPININGTSLKNKFSLSEF